MGAVLMKQMSRVMFCIALLSNCAKNKEPVQAGLEEQMQEDYSLLAEIGDGELVLYDSNSAPHKFDLGQELYTKDLEDNNYQYVGSRSGFRNYSNALYPWFVLEKRTDYADDPDTALIMGANTGVFQFAMPDYRQFYELDWLPEELLVDGKFDWSLEDKMAEKWFGIIGYDDAEGEKLYATDFYQAPPERSKLKLQVGNKSFYIYSDQGRQELMDRLAEAELDFETETDPNLFWIHIPYWTSSHIEFYDETDLTWYMTIVYLEENQPNANDKPYFARFLASF